MIIGAVAFLTMLFSGSPDQIYFVDNIEKGVKVYVEDKDRKKELESIFKAHAKQMKLYYKERGKLNKALGNALVEAPEDVSGMLQKIAALTANAQKNTINTRLKSVALIEEPEWEQMVALALEKTSKKEKQEAKEKKAFQKFDAAVQAVLKEQKEASTLLKGFDVLKTRHKGYIKRFQNQKIKDILYVKTSGKPDLEQVTNFSTEVYGGFSKELIEFNTLLLQHCEKKAHKKIVKLIQK